MATLHLRDYFVVCFYRIDDIEDSSTLRRGVPVAHHIYGTPTTLNSANYVYFLGLQKLLALGKPGCAEVCFFVNILIFYLKILCI